MTIRTLVFLAIVALSKRLVAQDTTRLGGRLDSATQAVVMRSVDSARTRGLPVEPLVDKALEGATKRAAGPRIQAAVSALLRRLELARDALAYGATREALATMRAIRPNESVAVPLGVLTQLVASGVSVARATRAVADLLRRGARDEQLIALNEDVRSYVAAGASPEAALDVRARGLTAVLPPGGGSAVLGDAAAPGTQSAGSKKP